MAETATRPHRRATEPRSVPARIVVVHPEELSGLFLHKDDRQKHRNRCRCRGKNRSPYLFGTLKCSIVGTFAHFTVPVNVFQHNN